MKSLESKETKYFDGYRFMVVSSTNTEGSEKVLEYFKTRKDARAYIKNRRSLIRAAKVLWSYLNIVKINPNTIMLPEKSKGVDQCKYNVVETDEIKNTKETFYFLTKKAAKNYVKSKLRLFPTGRSFVINKI